MLSDLQKNLHVDMKSISLRNISELHLEAAKVCNLSCGYCYSWPLEASNQPLMSLKVAYDIIELVINSTSCMRIEIVLHGGEPLLQSASWLESVAQHALRVARRHCKKIRFVMQSNCTLLDDEQLRVLKRFNVCVGTSLDGAAFINDEIRGNTSDLYRNASRLKAAGLLGDVICVIGEHNIGRLNEVFDHFIAHGFTRISTIIRRSVGRSADLSPLSSASIYQSYKDILEYLAGPNGDQLLEKTMAAKINRYITPPNSEYLRSNLICSHPICGAGVTTIYCDTEGRMLPCGMSVQRSDLILGTIDDVKPKYHVDIITNMYSQLNEKRKLCSFCRAAAICSFGCPAIDAIDVLTADAECVATQQLYDLFNSIDRSTMITISQNQERIKCGAIKQPEPSASVI